MVRKRQMWSVFLMSIMVAIWLPAYRACSQSNSNYTIERYVLDNGRGESWSNNYTLCHSVGQQFLGITNLATSPYMSTVLFYAGCPPSAMPLPTPTETPSAVVPEPASFFLIVTGLISLFIFVRRNLRQKDVK